MMTLILLVLSVLLWALPAQAAVLETNEWNNLTDPGWTYGPGTYAYDAAPAGGSSPSGGGAFRSAYAAGVYSSSVPGGYATYTPASGTTPTVCAAHWIKWSNPFDWNPQGTKIDYQQQTGTDAGGSFTENFYIMVQGAGGSLRFTQQLQRPPNSQNRFANLNAATITRGVWYWISWCATENTVGTPNGIFDLWLNDVQQMHHTDVTFRTNNQSFGTLSHAPEWGGGGGTINQTQYIWRDHTVISTTRTPMPGGAPVGDTTPPSTPTLIASASGGGQGNPSWTAATDNSGAVAGYELERCPGAACTNFTILTTTAAGTLYHTDLTVAPSTTYRYRVKAFDGAGNRSNPSTIVNMATTATFKSVLAPSPDTYTRANNTDLGAAYDAGYTAQGPCQIVTNRIRSTTVNTRCYETYNGVTPSNDQWGQLTISTLAGAQLADICVPIRAANAAVVTSYAVCAVRNGANTMEIREYTTGTPVVLVGNSTYTPTTADKIRAEVEGTTIRGYLIRPTGQEILAVGPFTDASIASGKVGTSMFVATGGSLANVESDDLVVGDFGAGASTTVGFESVSLSPDNETTNTTSWTHTTAATANPAFIGCAYARSTTQTPTQVSTYTLGGQPLTFVRRDTRTGSGTFLTTEVWRLFNPSPGSATATIVWAGVPTEYGIGTGVGLTNVSAASGVDANAGGTGSSGTLSAAITTVADHAGIVDCALARADTGMTVGAGQVQRSNRVIGVSEGTNDYVGVSTVLDKTPAAAETMDWTQTSNDWALSTVSVVPATVTPVMPPTIATMILSSTGAALTAGATTPTRMRVAAGNNVGNLSYADNVPWSTTYTHTWESGMEFACFYPIDSAGVENTASSAYLCNTLIGIAPALDTTPIVMTQTAPASTFNQGTTSTVFSISIDKGGNCKWDTVNTTYDLMANTMTGASLSESANTGAILSNGTTTHVYTQCQFTNSVGSLITTTTALDVSITVAAGAPTDTTLPSTVPGLACDAAQQAQVPCIWGAATDNVAVSSYNVYLCGGAGCTPDIFAGNTGNVTQTILNLAPSTLYGIGIKALDSSNNESAALSNIEYKTTTAIFDVTPPSNPTNLRICGGPFTAAVLLCWDNGSDNAGAVTASIEQCTGATCTDFVGVQSQITTQQLQVGLTPGQLYRFRFFWVDQSNNRSLAYSNIVDVTTAMTGLPRPRLPIPFGVQRLPRN